MSTPSEAKPQNQTTVLCLDELCWAAHEYAEQGWPVLVGTFSKGSDGRIIKKPLTKWRNGKPGQLATTDHAVIDKWFRDFGRRIQLIGIATGKASGVVVLDVDPHCGGDVAALNHPLPQTLTATTGSGGSHHVFRYRDGITNSAKGLPKGIDVRGEGGYIVVEPSVNPKTQNAYEWLDQSVPPVSLPDWLYDVLRADPAPSAAEPTPIGPPTQRDKRWATAILEELCVEQAGYAHGDRRNEQLNQHAVRLFRISLGGMLDPDEVRDRLAEAGQRSGTSGIKATLDSAWKKAQQDGPALGPDGEVGKFAHEDDDLGTWAAVDLSTVLDGSHEPTRPTVLKIGGTDRHLFYAAKIHVLNAESETGKTWLALHAAQQEVEAGHHVFFYDFEDDAHTVTCRLLDMGVPADAIDKLFHYAAPDEPMTAQRRTALLRLHNAIKPTLIITDGVTEVMGQNGWAQKDNDDIATFYNTILKPFARCGAAVVALDHLPKYDEGKRGAIGGVHKLNGVDGAVYRLEAFKEIAPGREGVTRIKHEKDRPGQVKKHSDEKKRVADLIVDAEGEGLRVYLELPDVGTSSEAVAAQPKRSTAEDKTLSVLSDEWATTGDLVKALKTLYGGSAPSRATVQRNLKTFMDTCEIERKVSVDASNRDVHWWRLVVQP